MAPPPPRGRFYVEKFLGLRHSVGVACIGCVYLSIFDEFGFVALVLTAYAAVVTRSHWIQLCEAATPALGYASVVGEESDVKPAADKV